jgi:hypothetical protein
MSGSKPKSGQAGVKEHAGTAFPMIARFLSAVLAIALQSQVHPTCAATLSPNDYEQAKALAHPLSQLGEDVLNSARATNPNSAECLLNIETAVAGVEDNLKEVIDLIGLSISMQSAADERTVNMMVALQLKLARDLLANFRGRVNLNAGHCGRDGNVTEKARQALGLFSRLDGVYGTLQSKLVATQR